MVIKNHLTYLDIASLAVAIGYVLHRKLEGRS